MQNQTGADTQTLMLLLDTLIPVLPGGRVQLLDGPTMAGELWYVHRVSCMGQTLGDVSHFNGCTPEPVNLKEPSGPLTSLRLLSSIGIRCSSAFGCAGMMRLCRPF